MAVLEYLTNTFGESFILSVRYELIRDGTLISFFETKNNEAKPENFTPNGTLHPNLTWVDIPSLTGNHTYDLKIKTSTLTSGLQLLDVYAASLNAIVFSPKL